MTGKPSIWMALLAAVGSLSAAGCGSTNPPCAVDVTEVDAARATAASAEEQVASLRAEKARLEKEIASAESRREDLERRKAEIEAKIAELGG